ncbi:MAG: RidA family protein [Saprospiraceae bacterium]|nr:RidA family protein [Saprospiraceae bacterium]
MGQDLKYITRVEGRTASSNPLSLAVWAGDFCYVSGQLGLDALTGKPPVEFEQEVQNTMEGIKAILASQQLDFAQVVKTTVYLTDLKDFAAMNEVYRRYFPEGKFPARETVQVAGLVKGARFEISMVAYKKQQ